MEFGITQKPTSYRMSERIYENGKYALLYSDNVLIEQGLFLSMP